MIVLTSEVRGDKKLNNNYEIYYFKRRVNYLILENKFKLRKIKSKIPMRNQVKENARSYHSVEECCLQL